MPITPAMTIKRIKRIQARIELEKRKEQAKEMGWVVYKSKYW